MTTEPAFLSDPDLLESRVLAALFGKVGGRIDGRTLAYVARRLEGGEMRSRTLRRLLWRHYNVRVEAFSYGAFHRPGASEPGLIVGRYASVARDARWGVAHPLNHVSLSPAFAQPENGFVEQWPFERPALDIGHDAWIGALAVITSNCRRIGIGAVIGAGTIVTRDVPDFAVVVGVPARIVRFRFSDDVQAAVLRSRWWERPQRELLAVKDAFTGPVDDSRTLDALARLPDRIVKKDDVAV